MLIRLILSSLISLVNAIGSLVRYAKAARASASEAPSQQALAKRGNAFPIGREIVNLADVTPSPALGDTLYLSFTDLLSHLYAPGRTGCGKTSLLTVLADAFVKHHKSFVVIDARGDLIDRLLTRMAAAGDAKYWKDRLVIIDLPSQWSVPFNPFASGGDPYSIAQAIFDSIEERVSGGLGVQVSETLRSALIALAFGKRYTLLHIEPLLTNRAFRTQVLTDCTDPVVLSFWERYGALSPDQQTSWTGAVLNKVAPLLAVPQMRRMIGQTECLPVRRIIDTPGTALLIKLGISELHAAAGLLGSMVSSAIIQSAMARAVDTTEGNRNPVFLLCDEFENYANALFHEVIQEGRRMGIGIALFHQSLSQVKSATADLVLNNAKTMCLFATGARDAGHFSREIGGDEAWEARTVLTRQAVGQAYLLRRGEDPTRVKVEYTPDPRVDQSAVEAIRAAAFARYAKPAAAVDDEIAAGLAAIRELSNRPAPTAELATACVDTPIEAREVAPARRSRKERSNR